jgi:hypothetical protein
MQNHRYRPVQTTSDDGGVADAKKKHAERVERIQTKLHAALWVIVACCVVSYTDFIKVILTDGRINRMPLNLAVMAMVVIVSILCYLCVYLPIFEKISDYRMWEVHCPNMIPMLTGAGAVCIISLTTAMWPVWGIFSPVLVFFLMMGFMFVAHFIPSC